jgi:hypothetical protein
LKKKKGKKKQNNKTRTATAVKKLQSLPVRLVIGDTAVGGASPRDLNERREGKVFQKKKEKKK